MYAHELCFFNSLNLKSQACQPTCSLASHQTNKGLARCLPYSISIPQRSKNDHRAEQSSASNFYLFERHLFSQERGLRAGHTWTHLVGPCGRQEDGLARLLAGAQLLVGGSPPSALATANTSASGGRLWGHVLLARLLPAWQHCWGVTPEDTGPPGQASGPGGGSLWLCSQVGSCSPGTESHSIPTCLEAAFRPNPNQGFGWWVM